MTCLGCKTCYIPHACVSCFFVSVELVKSEVDSGFFTLLERRTVLMRVLSSVYLFVGS